MAEVVKLQNVSVVRDGRTLIGNVDLSVNSDQRWVILGPNGSGKTTLMRVAGLYLHPSAGEVSVFGQRLGSTDVRKLRTRIGIVSAAFADMLRRELTAEEIVMTAKNAALEPWWHEYSAADRQRARQELARLGVERFADARFGTLSSGERQRVLLARTLMGDPGLILLDEPAAGLDLGGREELVNRIGALAEDAAMPPMLMVTHHLEEIPDGFTHALLLREAKVVAQGPLEDVLTSQRLSECFGMKVHLDRREGRWFCWAPRDQHRG